MAASQPAPPLLPPPGITCAQLLRYCGREPKPEEPLGFSIRASRFHYKHNKNPAPDAYRTERLFPAGGPSFSVVGFGPLASRSRRMPPMRIDIDASPADVRVQYDRFQRADYSHSTVSRVFTGPAQTGDEWTRKGWIPSPDTYSPEKCPNWKLRVPPVRFQFESHTLRDGELPRLRRNARYPGPNHYDVGPAERNKVAHGAESDFRDGVRRITWLDDPIRRGRRLPAPNQYSRCHSESNLLGGGRTIAPEGPEEVVEISPGPGEYNTAGVDCGSLPTFNRQRPPFLSSAQRAGNWTDPRGRPPGPGAYDVPRLYGNAELVFNWRQRFKWI
ncbi:hypothetical protein FJT64_003312 [Amphibalanus amphitrite]|uniref:Uncharacterized protein n=1 Tax=Amphibalanus amphitrite TaxID=1232801 RepID=A0A6A4WB58_AMPAM|nr:hypothetical protein FJT64_003312 [Amphibalanus amphitrite]